jgi:hypothetical protein
MDELDRLFERLVRALAEDARLAVPFPAAEVYERLVPYRSNRSRLKVATHQDYEMQREVREANPDPAYFRNFPDARAMVNGRAAERVLLAEQAYAPPDAEEEPVDYTGENPIPHVVIPFPTRRDAPTGNQCVYCGGMLPGNRKVNFCPHCGQPPSGELKCPACGSEVDVGWTYCISCGRGTGFE